jgi:hypothetical protein
MRRTAERVVIRVIATWALLAAGCAGYAAPEACVAVEPRDPDHVITDAVCPPGTYAWCIESDEPVSCAVDGSAFVTLAIVDYAFVTTPCPSAACIPIEAPPEGDDR